MVTDFLCLLAFVAPSMWVVFKVLPPKQTVRRP